VVTVLLSGQGADEVLAGYRVHLAPRLARTFGHLPEFLRSWSSNHLFPFLQKHRYMPPGIPRGLLLAACRHLQRVFAACGLPAPDQYILLRSYLDSAQLGQVLSSDIKEELAGRDYSLRFRQHFEACASEAFLNQMLYVDMRTFLPDLNLTYSDKLSMAASIEVRVPFLDNDIVDFLSRVPPGQKIRGTTQKYILRRAMRDRLPKGVLKRRKAGFGLPFRSWLRSELREMVADLLSPAQIRKRGLFAAPMVEQMIQANQSGASDYTLQIWSLLTLEIWQRTFVDQRRFVESPLAQPLAVGH
jgi:asparagine synthase (glutamine-hydrolysing)